MYIIKNAVKNIGRNKGRNILMAVIIFAIILTTAVSTIINTTTKEIIRDYKTRFGSEVTIEFDYERSDINYAELENVELKNEQLISFGESEYLKSAEYYTSMLLSFDKLRALDDDKKGIEMGGVIGIDGDASVMTQHKYIKVLGQCIASNSPNISEDFQKGIRKITDGKMYSAKDECLVSEQFAKLNNLSVGDSITVKTYYEDKPLNHTLKISGIYADHSMEKGNIPEMYEFTPSAQFNRNNEILVSFDTAMSMEMSKEEYYAYVQATYFLKDPSMLEAYQKELTQKGLPDCYKVSTDEAGYNRIVGPVEGLSKITNTFLIVVLVLGSAVLVLLSTLAIRERKYEIGVLRAMGMKKSKVALGLLSEMLVITSACLIIGLGVGTAISQPVADSMLKSQIEQAENQNNDMGAIGTPVLIGDDRGDQKPLSELQVHLNSSAILQIFFISLALAGISSLVGILYITKYEPMKILSERN